MMIVGIAIVGLLALIWFVLILEEVLWMGIRFFGRLLRLYYRYQSLYWTLKLWYYKQRGDYAQEDQDRDTYTGVSDTNGQAASYPVSDPNATEEIRA